MALAPAHLRRHPAAPACRYNSRLLTTSLSPGTRLGSYEILGAIGAGGMGEVYRARDTRLDRDVAIKILPGSFADDPARRARFDREAKTLASLNHPNIAHIHGVIESPLALVMELVEGEDLAHRLARGPLALDDALPIARQIADGLEAAHEQGIIHRDLKPANVKVRTDGTAKVLDFGLAKGLGGDVAHAQSATDHSPTVTSPVPFAAGTEIGIILGTAAYMAPEQARGRTVDRRADIWAFGCVLYEMLAGRRPFAGDDASMMLAAILKEDVDFTALPAGTPTSIRRLLRRCLEKDPRKRLSAIGDARLDLDEAVAEARDLAPLTTSARSWGGSLAWAAGGALLATLGGGAAFLLRADRPHPREVVRAQIALGMPLRLSNNRAFALNPAGTELVFVGQIDADHFGLFRRRLADEQSMAIADTEGATGPFFSPDGQWLAFVQNRRLKKMPAAGGAVVDLGEAPGMHGGSFAPDGSVVFNASHGELLMRVPASGGEARGISTVDRDKGEAGHHWPDVLPDGKHALVTVEIDGKAYSDARILLRSLEDGSQRVLIDGGTDARYLPTGEILYWHDKALWSIRFDVDRLQTTGPATPILKDVMMAEPNGHAHYSVAANGTLAYLAGRDTQEEVSMMLVDRSGAARQLTGEQKNFATPAISPDGRRLVASISAANDSLWTMDMDRQALTRITYEAENAFPVWSPDGSRIAWARHSGGNPRQLFVMPSDGSGTPELLHPSSRPEMPQSWGRQGNVLAFSRFEATGWDVWIMKMDGDRTPRPFLNTRFDEANARFSPDGKWLAYTSNESGRTEVYITPYPGPGRKRVVSTAGGSEPRWRADGREIFYRLKDAVLSADVTFAPELSSSVPRVLFRRTSYISDQEWPTWDVLPDGQGFLMLQDFATPRTTVTLVQNWFEELRHR